MSVDSLNQQAPLHRPILLLLLLPRHGVNTSRSSSYILHRSCFFRTCMRKTGADVGDSVCSSSLYGPVYYNGARVLSTMI